MKMFKKKVFIRVSILAMITLTLSILGYDLAQLQADLEAPSDTSVFEAEQKALKANAPKSILKYPTFKVAVDKELSISVYARESDNAVANILLVHGAGGGAWVWEYFFQQLPVKYNLYALSWRGHFDSTKVSDANASDYMLDQQSVSTEITKRNKLPLHIIGHSYGAATSVLQVSKSDSDIASLILLAPVVPLDYTVAQRLLVPALAPYFIRKSLKQGNQAEGTFGGMFLSKKRMHYYYELYAKHDYSKEKPSLIAVDGISPQWQQSLLHSYQELANRDIPVSIFIARYDNVVVPKRQRKLAKLIKANVIETSSGHYLPIDVGEDEIIKVIIDILEKA